MTILANAEDTKAVKTNFPTKIDFYRLLDTLAPLGQEIYEDEFDEMLEEEYGKIVGEDPEM
ncbi:MAG: hypothetical protein IJ137_01885 [Eubacterium sp.]|nr:hypothetical protein [Eubacterium sp.]